MKYLKKFESFDDMWQDVQSSLDVYQLYELLLFKYGSIFYDTKDAIDEEEGDYNPDHIYEIIEYELKAKKLWEDFLNNFDQYQNEKDEADPFHWKHRNKIMKHLGSNWDDMD